MPYAINLFFDTTTEETIRAIWKALADVESATYLYQSGARPHIKLAVYQTLDLNAVEQRLQALAAATDTIPVIFKQVGVFPNPRPTVFLGTVVTLSLLELQQQVCQALQEVASGLALEYFAPDQWLPHCLLALDVEPEALASVLNIGMQCLPLPFAGEIQGVGIVEFRPPKLLGYFPFRDYQDGPSTTKVQIPPA